jgi:hypothetical protein
LSIKPLEITAAEVITATKVTTTIIHLPGFCT